MLFDGKKALSVSYDNKIKEFNYSPNPSFGSVIVPITLSFELGLKDSKPEVVNISTETNFSLSGFTSALHYGQSIFEGMKAFKEKRPPVFTGQ